jgi:opacity protein-like surface antigen
MWRVERTSLRMAAILVSTAAIPALADELPSKAPLSPSVHNWAGFYGGYNAGAAFGSYDARTTALPGGTYLFDPADIAAVGAAGVQNTRPNGFTGGAQAGYNWQSGHWLLGVETDLDFVHLQTAVNGPVVRYAVGPHVGVVNFNGIPFIRLNEFTINSDAHTDWLYTLRPRVGYAQGNWLFYATGGLALTSLQGDFSFADGVTPIGQSGIFQFARRSALTAGYTFGGGVEVALTGRLSAKAEVLDVRFPDVLAPQTFSQIPFGLQQSFRQSFGLHADLVRLGLNYRFGGGEQGSGDLPGLPFKALVQKAPPAFSNWAVEVGTRTWLSSGRYGAPQPLVDIDPPPPAFLASRLIFSNLNTLSGEVFGRVDHASGFFLKGYIGAGGIGQGRLNDEDFPGFHAYSNTLSGANGHLAYATIDAGYNFLKTKDASVGAFVGYNYYAQAIDILGCAQLAGDSACNPASHGDIGVTDDNAFHSFRVGLSSQVTLSDRLKLTAEAAYVPLVNFGGLDNHTERQLLIPEFSSRGNGVMLEAILNYEVMDHWNIGIGGRYWAWNLNTGSEVFNVLSIPAGPGNPNPETARFKAERYGVFLQSSYRWGDATPLAAKDAPAPGKAQANWAGFYAGGHLGGAASDDHWSDPFGSTPDFFGGGFTNVAGFGDTIHATGPLGGVQAGYNFQAGHWVYGVQADISAANVKGENTCFSGIDGINCQRIVNSISTFTGRVGYAWGGALLYAKGGAAMTRTTYNVDGNTIVLLLGAQNATATVWGWTAGAGLEYAINKHWSTFIEYDHVGLNNTTVAFPMVDFSGFIATNPSFSIRQNINLVKLGLNYHLGGPGI